MLVPLVFLILATCFSECAGLEDICEVCDCLPFGQSPTHAFCVDKKFSDKVFWPSTTPRALSLEVVYISGMKTINFGQNAFNTAKPLDLIIQNCSNVHISDHSMNGLRSLVMQDVKVATVGAVGYSKLWTLVLEDIEQLILDTTSFEANYTVKIRNVGSLTVLLTQQERICENLELQFSLSDSELNHIPEGGLTVCGNQIKFETNTFKSVAEGGLQIIANTNIKIVNNHFQYLVKNVFNLSSPEIKISGNNFDTLPAGALSGVSTIQNTSFTNNTIKEIDLGGVLLDMGWGLTIEDNIINCDCTSKRTSILNPKHDMLYLTNSTLETLQNIFLNNYCSMKCTVTLKAFSDALIQGEVCRTNNSRLEEEKLCDISPEYGSKDDIDQSLVSAASKVDVLVPVSIIAATILITSSVCYGFKEMKTFKFVFDPQRN